MDENICKQLADVLRQAYEDARRDFDDFVATYGYPPTTNHATHSRLSIIIALLRAHPLLDVVEGSATEWGRVLLIMSQNPTPFVLKALSALLPNEIGIQGQLEDMPPGVPLIAYEITDETIALYEGWCERIHTRSNHTRDRIIGDLHQLWRSAPDPFDQEDDQDSEEGEAGTGW